MKKVIVHFDFPAGTKEQYDQVWNDLRALGYGNPKGLIFHTGGAKPDGRWFIVDVWESEKAFREFRKVLMPLIEKNRIPIVRPEILPASYLYHGHKEADLS